MQAPALPNVREAAGGRSDRGLVRLNRDDRLPLEVSFYVVVQFSLSQGDKTATNFRIYRPRPSAKTDSR